MGDPLPVLDTGGVRPDTGWSWAVPLCRLSSAVSYQSRVDVCRHLSTDTWSPCPLHTGLVFSVEVRSPTLTDSSDSGLGRLPTINLEIQIQVQAPDLFFSHFIAPIPSQVLAELRTYTGVTQRANPMNSRNGRLSPGR